MFICRILWHENTNEMCQTFVHLKKRFSGMQRILKTFLLLIFPYALAAQTGEDFSWWNAIHQWDGHTSWEQYMTMSPAFMGPNALPVPDIQNGRLSDEIQVEQLAGYQFSTGDKTKDLFSRVYIPCLLYTSPSPRDRTRSRMPSSA